MFTITCNCTFLSLHIFVEVKLDLHIFVKVKLDLIPFSFFTSFGSHFDTTPPQFPITVNAYPQKNQGEWIR